MAFTHGSFLESREILKISNPLGWKILYIFTSSGFAILQGMHQEAQKSISMTLPFKELRLIGFPEGSVTVNSGAISPTSIFMEAKEKFARSSRKIRILIFKTLFTLLFHLLYRTNNQI
jgi:hypothetical protein